MCALIFAAVFEYWSALLLKQPRISKSMQDVKNQNSHLLFQEFLFFVYKIYCFIQCKLRVESKTNINVYVWGIRTDKNINVN